MFNDFLEIILKTLLECLIEMVFRNPWNLFVRRFRNDSQAAPDGFHAIVFGLIFWSLAGFGIYCLLLLLLR